MDVHTVHKNQSPMPVYKVVFHLWNNGLPLEKGDADGRSPVHRLRITKEQSVRENKPSSDSCIPYVGPVLRPHRI